jgi:hypothetical protein
MNTLKNNKHLPNDCDPIIIEKYIASVTGDAGWLHAKYSTDSFVVVLYESIDI